MSDLRKAAQAVLSAWDDPTGMPNLCRALDALRAALAEPEQEPKETDNTAGWSDAFARAVERASVRYCTTCQTDQPDKGGTMTRYRWICQFCMARRKK